MSGRGPDTILRKLGDSLEKPMATEQQIRMAFYEEGYGDKRTQHWWDFYRTPKCRIIMPLTKDGQLVRNEKNEQLYTCKFWLPEDVRI